MDYIGVYRTTIIGFEGPKYYNVNGIWALKPHCLGPWTLGFYNVWNSLVLLQFFQTIRPSLWQWVENYIYTHIYIYIWGLYGDSGNSYSILGLYIMLCGLRL